MASTDDCLDAATLDGGIRLLTMKRPAARNALNLALLASLAAEFDAARHDAATTVVVLTGDEKAFSAGADIREMSAKGWDAIEDESRNASWQTMRDFPKPFIAAVRGHALGGGNELAMLADLVIAGEGAVFGQPEAMIGGIPGDGGTQRLPRLVGRQLAMRMFLTGERLSGREAFAAGLVCAVVPDAQVVDEAVRLAKQIAAAAPASAIAIKSLVRASQELSLDEGLRLERELLRQVFGSADHLEGMRAFVERRPPVWRGTRG